MLDCIEPSLRDEIQETISSLEESGRDLSTIAQRLIIASNSIDTITAWEHSRNLFKYDEKQGQEFLFLCLYGSLDYFAGRYHTPAEAIDWRDSFTRNLSEAIELLYHTPKQFNKYLNRDSCDDQSRFYYLKEIQRLHDLLQNAKPEQGIIPAKPASDYAPAQYFVRSMHSLLMPVTENTKKFILPFVKGIFCNEMDGRQYNGLISSVTPDKSCLESIYRNYPRFD